MNPAAIIRLPYNSGILVELFAMTVPARVARAKGTSSRTAAVRAFKAPLWDKVQVRILDATAKVFARNGPAGATIAEIGEAAEMPAATAYCKFWDRAGLYGAVLRGVHDHGDQARGHRAPVGWEAWVPNGSAPARTTVEAKLASSNLSVEVTVTALRAS